MRVYGFSLVNHLGEPFERCELICRDDAHALECAESLSAKCAQVEVRLAGECIGSIHAGPWQAERWRRRILE